MANFCIPKAVSAKFKEALDKGDIDSDKLRRATSEERRKAFEPIFGPDMAKEVNALFESKLLLKDQQAGLTRWANQLQGIPEKTRKSIIDQINNLGRVLDPNEKKKFLNDLASQKLGAEVTPEEAKALYELSMDATAAKAELSRDIDSPELQQKYGAARQALTEKFNQLKGADRFDPYSLKAWGNLGLETLGIPKAILSSIDLSAPFVQGWGMMSTGRFWQAMPKMLRYFASEKNFHDLNSRIIGHPYYDLALDGGLGITSIEQPARIGAREEAFQSHLVEQMVQHVSDFSKEKFGIGVPNAFRASDRAFTGFINYVRFYRFVDLVNAAKMVGEDVSLGGKTLKELSKVVNDFTGRGNLGVNDRYSNLGPILNNIFFSARKQSATINMFSGVHFLSASPTARWAALRQLLGSIIATGAVLTLAKLAGGDVNIDPRAQNFMQVRFPGSDTYFDFTGTNGTYLRLIGRLATNQKITSGGQLVDFNSGYKSGTRADELIQYVRGKLSPTASILANALYGTDPIGRPFDISNQLSQDLVPMTIGSYIDMANSPNETSMSELASITALFGVGMRPVHFTPSAYGINVWGNPEHIVTDDETRSLDEAAEQASYRPRLPPNTINGVKLSKEQHQEYVTLSGLISKQLLLPVIQSEAWDKTSPEEKAQTFKDLIGSARTLASTNLQAKYPGLVTESIKKSLEQK